jgi:hypothetical protein
MPVGMASAQNEPNLWGRIVQNKPNFCRGGLAASGVLTMSYERYHGLARERKQSQFAALAALRAGVLRFGATGVRVCCRTPGSGPGVTTGAVGGPKR